MNGWNDCKTLPYIPDILYIYSKPEPITEDHIQRLTILLLRCSFSFCFCFCFLALFYSLDLHYHLSIFLSTFYITLFLLSSRVLSFLDKPEPRITETGKQPSYASVLSFIPAKAYFPRATTHHHHHLFSYIHICMCVCMCV